MNICRVPIPAPRIEEPSPVFKHFCEAVAADDRLGVSNDVIRQLWEAANGDDRRSVLLVYDEQEFRDPADFENLARHFHSAIPTRKDHRLVHLHCYPGMNDRTERLSEAEWEAMYTATRPTVYDYANLGVLAIYDIHHLPEGRPQENLSHLMTEGRRYYRPWVPEPVETSPGVFSAPTSTALESVECSCRLFMTVDRELEATLGRQLRYDLSPTKNGVLSPHTVYRIVLE